MRTTLTITSFPADRKVAVIKAVRALTNIGLKEAKDAVETLPHLVASFDSRADAEAESKKLQDAGATCELTPRIAAEDDPSDAASSAFIADEGARDPIDIITNRLGRARAPLDMLCEIASRDDTYGLLEEFDGATLGWIFHDIRNRIDEANEAAEALHDQYKAATRTAGGEA